MLFTFKRDEEGRERIYVADVCVARIEGPSDVESTWSETMDSAIRDAIERADEAGFWGDEWCDDCGTTDCHAVPRKNEVTVDVQVAVLSVTVGGDES